MFGIESTLILLAIALFWTFVFNRVEIIKTTTRLQYAAKIGVTSAATWMFLAVALLALFILMTGVMWYPSGDVFVNTIIAACGGAVVGFLRWKKKEKEVVKEVQVQTQSTTRP